MEDNNNDFDPDELVQEKRQEMIAMRADHYQEMKAIQEQREANKEAFNGTLNAIKEDHSGAIALYALENPDANPDFNQWLMEQALQLGQSIELSQGRVSVVEGN